MSEIDVQNAKQIRNPMDVLIEMELPDESIVPSFSGYSSAKVADGKLNNPTWPMRKLADLQGDGFPLDGSHVLYDSSTSPSYLNKKIGVRSNIGEAVSVTVTANKTIQSLTVFVKGAESISYNGITTSVVGETAIIPVGARTISMTFNPADETKRIEVSEISPGTKFRITNDNLIKATVSLRSDLSVVNPTLPESEINVEVYQDTDISEIVAAIPEDTPIKYSAGYPGDMSYSRNFYVSGQITWENNALNIQAVDAVHFLDVDMPPMWIMDIYNEDVESLPEIMQTALESVGIMVGMPSGPLKRGGTSKEAIVVPSDTKIREVIAEVMNIFRFRNIPSQYCDDSGINEYVFTYVDAGQPNIEISEDSWRRRIKEEDCGSIKQIVDRNIGRIKLNRSIAIVFNGEVGLYGPMKDGVSVGSAQILKNEGVFLSLDDYVFSFMVGIESSKIGESGYPYSALAPAYQYGHIFVADPSWPSGSAYDYSDAHPLLSSEVKNGDTTEWENDREYPVYSQVIPWTIRYPTSDLFKYRSLQAAWNGLVARGIIGSEASYYDATLYGYKINFQDETIEVDSGIGETVEIESKLLGRSCFWSSRTSKGIEAFPRYGLDQLIRRSNKKGSFVWKGDPRMQPRDVIEFERLDGTVQEITLETITMTHENGGTLAEITYREGVV